jgi:thioredoxin-disulfide reductase
MDYDVIVIGMGPAGMTAGLYTARKNLKTLVLGMNLGGQTALATDIQNYPGFLSVKGFDLSKKMEEQAKKAGAEIKFANVQKVVKADGGFNVELSDGSFLLTKAVILGFGKTPRTMGMPGEKEFFGKGVSTCATCDGPFYKGKDVAIIGGGNSALDAALYLSEIANRVYIVHRRDQYRGDEITVDKVKKNEKIVQVLSYIPKEVKGDTKVTGLVVESVKDKSLKELKVDGVFLEIGYIVDPSMVKDLVKLNQMNEIVIDNSSKTNVSGIFAAGDCTNTPYKQTVISAGEGAKAGLEAYKFVSGSRVVGIDWH